MHVGPRSLDAAGRGRFALAGALIIIAAVAGAFLIVRLTGGSPNPWNHLGYLPILMAAYMFGLRGGLAAAIGVSIALGPYAALVGLRGGTEDATAWAIRAVGYVGIGALAGALFDRNRAALTRWRTTALEVAAQQRAGTIALARGAEAKDTDTGDHLQRIQLSSQILAQAAGMGPDDAAAIGWSAMLHDVGKLHVPDAILLKPDRLTPEEWQIMQRHTVAGAEILRDGPGFELARRIARWHHENIDGSGYPDGLRGDAIPLEARIVRVADAFDTMTHARPYKAAMSPEEALEELRRHAGTQFDPELVRLFLALIEQDPTLFGRLSAHRV